MQRFGSALQLALHLHVLVPDGVFVPPAGGDPEARPKFMALDPPTDEEVADVLKAIVKRVQALMKRRGRLGSDDVEVDPDDLLQRARALAARSPSRGAPSGANELPPRCARQDGYSLHANVAIHANDREGLERLCRYGARPALSLERLSEREDGRLEYRMKRTFSDGRHTITFTPHELLCRLVALIAPPRAHQTRYHGIFAPRARRRAALTGRKSKPRPATTVAPAPPPPSPPAAVPSSSTHERMPEEAAAPPPDPDRARRLPWADLIRRVHGADVKTCAACGGRLRIIAYVRDPDVTKKILDHLGLPSTAPPRGPPRAPPAPPPPSPRNLDLFDPFPLD